VFGIYGKQMTAGVADLNTQILAKSLGSSFNRIPIKELSMLESKKEFAYTVGWATLLVLAFIGLVVVYSCCAHVFTSRLEEIRVEDLGEVEVVPIVFDTLLVSATGRVIHVSMTIDQQEIAILADGQSWKIMPPREEKQ